MESRKIIVPVDFTPASDQAIKQAVAIASSAKGSITLFHVTGIASSDESKTELSGIESKLKEMAGKIDKEGISCDYSVASGSIFNEIPAIANKPGTFMMVIGTHGIHGIKQKMLGADILKIVRKISIPCLIVQENCICKDFNPIVFPVGGHEGFRQLIETTATMAELFNAEILLYSVVRNGIEESDKIKSNTLLAKNIFTERSVAFKRVREESNVISVGYARQALLYANQSGAGLISIMSVKSEENYYFAQADKETMINNEYNIPVLCVNGLENY